MAWIRTAIRGLTGIVLLAAISAGASAVGAGVEEAPRYRLEPGMVLSYEAHANLKVGSDDYIEEVNTTAWVVRSNPDGSRRVVVRVASRLREADRQEAGKTSAQKQQNVPMDYSLGYFDLFPDGRIGEDADLSVEVDPALVFPRLPDTPSTSEWGQSDPRTGQEYAYSSPRREADGWAFRAERLGPWKKVYGMNFGSTWHFARGMMVGADREFSQEMGARSHGRGKLVLAGVETKDAKWAAAFARSADRSIAALRDYKKSSLAAAKDVERGPSLMADARAKLQAVCDATDEPVFREEIARKLAGHDSRAKACAEAAKRRAEVVGKPSQEWSLQGLDGKTHGLKEYRGKVVVLDFWYRTCGWCVKAMPEMNTLVERFKGRPVVVLGMNIDAKEEDAKFVVDAMALKYETLRAESVPEKYSIRGFPTVVIVDPEGVVRDIHAGYSPTLGADLGRKIEDLLTPKR